MGYVQEILGRANLQGLREFLYCGCENPDYQTGSYEKRIEEASRIYQEIAEKYEFSEDSELISTINEVINTYETAYLEIGIQAGFLLAKDMFAYEKKEE